MIEGHSLTSLALFKGRSPGSMPQDRFLRLLCHPGGPSFSTSVQQARRLRDFEAIVLAVGPEGGPRRLIYHVFFLRVFSYVFHIYIYSDVYTVS